MAAVKHSDVFDNGYFSISNSSRIRSRNCITAVKDGTNKIQRSEKLGLIPVYIWTEATKLQFYCHLNLELQS